jgi:hypothetical protein
MAHILSKHILLVLSLLLSHMHSVCMDIGITEEDKFDNVRVNYTLLQEKYEQKYKEKLAHYHKENNTITLNAYRETFCQRMHIRCLIATFELNKRTGSTCMAAINHQIILLGNNYNQPLTYEFKEDVKRGFSPFRLVPYYQSYDNTSSSSTKF